MATAQSAREPRTLEKRLHAHYEVMPASERALADVILEYPGDLLLYSATALAQRAGVSKAAVTRLVKRLEYDDYREMQREVREAQEAGEPIYLNTSLIKPAIEGDALRRHLEQDQMNLRQTWEAIRVQDLDEVVRRTLAARQVWIIGFRNSYFFASYVRRQLVQVRSNVGLLPVPGQVLVEELPDTGARDLAIVIGLRRRTPSVKRVMRILRDQEVPVAYITDRVAVTTPKLATWVFPCQTRGTSLFDSYVGVISLLNYLCTEAVARAGETGRARLGRIEDLMEAMQEIDPDN